MIPPAIDALSLLAAKRGKVLVYEPTAAPGARFATVTDPSGGVK